MSLTRPSILSEFTDSYHLWSLIIPLVVLGILHLLDFTICLGFRFLAHANESYYDYKTRCVENRRRHEKLSGKSVSCLSQHPGG
jgi:hypothetical protein